jgi:hypothetical protein
LIFASRMHRFLSNFPGLLYMTSKTFFVSRSRPNYQPFETCSKYFLSPFFQFKIDICIYNAPIELKFSMITLHDLKNIFRVGFVTQLWTMWNMFKIFFVSRFFDQKLIFTSIVHRFLSNFPGLLHMTLQTFLYRVLDLIMNRLKHVQNILFELLFG